MSNHVATPAVTPQQMMGAGHAALIAAYQCRTDRERVALAAIATAHFTAAGVYLANPELRSQLSGQYMDVLQP